MAIAITTPEPATRQTSDPLDEKGSGSSDGSQAERGLETRGSAGDGSWGGGVRWCGAVGGVRDSTGGSNRGGDNGVGGVDDRWDA